MAAETVRAEASLAQRIRCEDVKPRMAKAAIAVVTIRDERAKYGLILRRASEIAGFNRDQTADQLQVDKAQISRWWSGDENPQVWRYHRHLTFRSALRLAEAEEAERDETSGVQVETIIRMTKAVG